MEWMGKHCKGNAQIMVTAGNTSNSGSKKIHKIIMTNSEEGSISMEGSSLVYRIVVAINQSQTFLGRLCALGRPLGGFTALLAQPG
jgi:hypothetical protein